MVQKAKLIELVRRGHAELVRFADNLSEEERQKIGEGDQWTARDLLSHVVEWRRSNTEDMNAYDRGEAVTATQDEDAENAARMAKYRTKSWDEVRQAVDQTQTAILALVERLTDEQLNDPQRYPFLNGRPAWRSVMSDSFMHPLASHLRPWYLQHGQGEYASHLAEEEARLLIELDDEPDWQGMTIYNLACHYALLGEKEKALEKLETGLRLNPGLADYSRQDSDFASLHGSPEFEAVVTGAQAA